MSDQGDPKPDPGEGPYADGEPRPATRDGHTSNPERFTDSGFETVPWTPERALRFAGVDPATPEQQRVAELRDAIDADRLPEQAVEVLMDAGLLPRDAEAAEAEA